MSLSRIRYQRITLIDKYFGGPGQLRFCAVVLMNGMRQSWVGYALSAPGTPWVTAIQEWFRALNKETALEECICVAGTPRKWCALELEEEGYVGEQAALSVALEMVLKHDKNIVRMDCDETFIDSLYDYVDNPLSESIIVK